MLLETLRGQRKTILALSDQYGARHVRVLGSVARGEERPDSDVDFLVDLPRALKSSAKNVHFEVQ